MELPASHTVVLPLVPCSFCVFFPLYFSSCQAALPSSWSTELSPEPLPSQTFCLFISSRWVDRYTSCLAHNGARHKRAATFKRRLSFAAVFRVEFCVVLPPRSVYSMCLCESQAVQARSRALKIVRRMTYTSALKAPLRRVHVSFLYLSSGCCFRQINCSENNNNKKKKMAGFGAMLVLP